MEHLQLISSRLFASGRGKPDKYHRTDHSVRFGESEPKPSVPGAGPLKPKGLKPGDTIAVVAPATGSSRQEMKEALTYLRNMGFKVIQYARTDRKNNPVYYLSDTDKGRAASLNKAFANPHVKAVFALEGGCGSFRPDFLNNINWEIIRQNPKIFTGYSDITFLHLAMMAKTGLTTFHARFPASYRLGSPDEKAFWEMVAQPHTASSVPSPIKPGEKYRCVVPGKATGTLIGGNLTTFVSALGTPYQPDLTGQILFLEDLQVDHEDIDCRFSQLVNHGLWDKIKGLIIGEFEPIPRPAPYTLKWNRFLRNLTQAAKQRGIPVGFNFPVGHINNNRPLPLGVPVEFNSKNGKLTFLESPVLPERASE